MPKKHVLLCSHDADHDGASRLREDLQRLELDVWWADEDVLGGQDVRGAVRRAMDDAYAVVVCLSRALNDAERSGLYPVLRSAIDAYREYPPGAVFVIPVRLDDCEVPDVEIDSTTTFRGLRKLDLFPDSERPKALQRLWKALENARTR